MKYLVFALLIVLGSHAFAQLQPRPGVIPAADQLRRSCTNIADQHRPNADNTGCGPKSVYEQPGGCALLQRAAKILPAIDGAGQNLRLDHGSSWS